MNGSSRPLRHQVAFEAARLLVSRDESLYYRARLRAAQRVYDGGFRQADLPTYREIRDQILEFARADRREIDPKNRGRIRALGESAAATVPDIDRFHVYAMLLAPLEKVHPPRDSAPEGDALYHSLQVFERARDALPYDEEFLLAALLHDVGKAIDPREHVAAALEALEGSITPRTAWLIEHHTEALALDDHTLGARCRHRLQASESFEELRLLARCDREGHAVGVPAADIEEALEYIRDLARSCGE